MTPGETSFFKVASVCSKCGKPSTKKHCDPCKVSIARNKALTKLRRNIFYVKKHKTKINQESVRRRAQNTTYGATRKIFLAQHQTCPVTGQPTTDIHHSAAREGAWLLVRRYWIAVSRRGHRIIEDNPEWAFANHLRVKVNALYDHHVQGLVNDGINIDEPLFYKLWNGQQISL